MEIISHFFSHIYLSITFGDDLFNLYVFQVSIRNLSQGTNVD